MKRENHSDSALTARAIKKRLKALYPDTKFSVTSDNFSMGDSVDIRWTDGPRQETIENITKQYQQGSFDGMTDCYNYEPIDSSLSCPGAKYVMCQRTASPELIVKLEVKALEYYSEFDTNDHHTYYKRLSDIEKMFFPKPEVQVESDKECKNTCVSGLDYKVIEDVDTRDNSQIYVVKVITKVDDFNALREQMKSIGGYYSKFKKGFIFKTNPADSLRVLDIENVTEENTYEQQEIESVNNISLLDKFSSVEIENSTRLAEDDQIHCKTLHSLYVEVLKHYRDMFEGLQNLTQKDEEFTNSISFKNRNNFYHAGYEYKIFEHKFVDMDKEKFANIIGGVHNRFIEKINDYFRDKYNVTIEKKEFNNYLHLEKPKEPDTGYWGYSRMTDEEIEQYKKRREIYEVEKNTYYDAIINDELNHEQVIDDIFLSLDGFSFTEKADKEIKDASIKASKNRWKDEPSYTIKNGKIALDILHSYKCSIFKRYEVKLDDEDYKAILKSLTYFDTNYKQTDIYNGWVKQFVGYRKTEEDGIYETHDVGGNKVKQFKFYKNGKLEIIFDNHNSALKFAKEFLWYTSQVA